MLKYFHLMGEPLLHPDLEAFLAIAGELGFRVMITTNGILLREKGEILCKSPALIKVNISLQSFEANEGGELTNYLDGCITFAEQANAAGKRCEFRLWNRNGLDKLNPAIEARLESAFPKPWKQSREGWRLRENLWLEPGERFDWIASIMRGMFPSEISSCRIWVRFLTVRAQRRSVKAFQIGAPYRRSAAAAATPEGFEQLLQILQSAHVFYRRMC